MTAIRNYALVTAAYWAFTLSDGALRMLVLLHFHRLGYTPVELAFLFVFYELFGVVTNLVGGFVAARLGLRATLLGGLGLQVVALAALAALDPAWGRALSVTYVMSAQALSGIAKDLTKMSAKSAIKVLVPPGADSALFKWVSVLTGSKNALKGVGFFLGGLLLAGLGFRGALVAMAAGVALTLAGSALSLPREIGKAKGKAKFRHMLSKNRAVNVLSAARFFLFGARDIWFVVGVPVFLTTQLGWGFTEVGGFLAAWVIGYGVVQSITPVLIKRFTGGRAPHGTAATVLAAALALVIGGVIAGVHEGVRADALLVVGLGVFGVVFAINSAVHSYLILAYSDGDKVTMNVGFYYMANAGGRLAGTVLSGVMYAGTGLVGCLAASAAFALAAAVLAARLPRGGDFVIPDGVDVGGD
ncbi:MAG TPA: organoarsenical effux MFS transporter ArsJ [Kofleriaceae bacterium]|nr:organoarsenical effux MFS transporter ArsJ [Kofleriaceae bacterium]